MQWTQKAGEVSNLKAHNCHDGVLSILYFSRRSGRYTYLDLHVDCEEALVRLGQIEAGHVNSCLQWKLGGSGHWMKKSIQTPMAWRTPCFLLR